MKKWKARCLSGLLAFSMIPLPQATILAAETADPVLSVSFDEENANDAANGLNGTIQGEPEFGEGISGKAIHLVNEDSGDHVDAHQYVKFPVDEKLTFGSDDFTLSFWYRLGKEVGAESSAISNKDWYSGSNVGFNIGQMKQGLSINFRADGSDGRKDSTRESAFSDQQWHHVAAIFDRDSKMLLYCDGKLLDTTDISAQAGLSIDTGNPLVLGANGVFQNGIEDAWFDELKVFKTALGEQEIQDEIGSAALLLKLADYRAKAAASDASDERKQAFASACDAIEAAVKAGGDMAALQAQLSAAWSALFAPEEGLYSFEVLSDTHIPGSDMSDATNQKLIDALDDIKRDYPNVKAVLNAGDFSSNGSASQVQGYFDTIAPYKNDLTILTALGNHDVRWQGSYETVRQRYLSHNGEYMGETNGKVYFDKWVDNAHYIILNSERDLKDRTFLSEEQLAWLDEKLAESDEKNVPSFIVLHQALGDTYRYSSDWSVGVQENELRDIMRQHNGVFLFTGHIHDGEGAIDVTKNDCGVQVDVPSLKDNDYGDRRGQLGWHVTVYEDSVRLDLRDYAANEWVDGYSQTFRLEDLKASGSKVLEVDFDDETASDKSGNGHNGTITGNVSFVDDGKGGKAVRIDNSADIAGTTAKADSYIDFGEDIQFGSDDFTVSFSYKAELDVIENAILSNKDWSSGSNPGFTIGDFNQSNRGMTLNFRAQGSSGRKDTSRVAEAQDGSWHDVYAVFDRDGDMTLYLDGKKAASSDISAQKDLSIDVEGKHLVLGADGTLCDGARGIIVDDLKIVKNAAGAREVEAAWNPYTVTVNENSAEISWDKYYDGVVPSKALLNGSVHSNIAADAKSVVFEGLQPGRTYTLGIVNCETANSGNMRDAQDFTITMPGELVVPDENAPVLSVSFDENNANDSINALHGKVNGEVEYVDGVNGKAIHLVNEDSADGVDAHQFVEFPQSDLLKFGSEDFSLSFWYKAGKETTREGAAISNKDWYSGNNNGFCLGQMRQGMTINFRADGSSGRKDTSREGVFSDQKWHHVAAVFDRDGKMTIYCDGKEQASQDISDQAGLSIDTGFPLVLGANGKLQNGIEDSYFDDLKVYKRTLSQEEILKEVGNSALLMKIAEYREKAAASEASDERKAAFTAACDEIAKKAVEEDADIPALEEQLSKAWAALFDPEDGLYSFEVLSDTHIPGSNMNDATNQKLIDALDDIKRDYPDVKAVLHAGDFSSNGSNSQVQGYFDTIAPYKNDLTFLTALGNHDVRWQGSWKTVYDRYMRLNGEYMGDTDGKVYFDKWIDDAHFIILNTEWELKDRAYLSEEQLSWLDAKLAESDAKNAPSFIVLHQALGDTYRYSSDWSVGVQENELRDVLRAHDGVFLFTGHIHDGVGAIDVTQDDCGVQVDVPSLKDNDYGDGRGQLGWHVTVYEDSVRLDLRDYKANEWVDGYSKTFKLADLQAKDHKALLDVDFDDETASDKSGSKNDGTVVGNVSFVDDGHGGKAAKIENSSAVAGSGNKADAYIDFGEDIQFGTDDFTVSFTYKADLDVTENALLSNKDWSTGSNEGFTIADFNQESNRGMTLNFKAVSGTRKDTSRQASVQDGKWHDIAAVFDRDKNMTLYIDGKKAASSDISAQKDLSIDVEGKHLVLGADGNFCYGTRSVTIDNLKIVRKAIGEREIEALWNPYVLETGKDSVTVSWDKYYDGMIPAKAILDGTVTKSIAADAKSVTFDGLDASKEHTVLIVNCQSANTGNYRDAQDFTFKLADRTQLQAAIADAEELKKDAHFGKIAQADRDALNDALAQAEEVLSADASDQKEIDQQTTLLEAAIAACRQAAELDFSLIDLTLSKAASLEAADMSGKDAMLAAKAQTQEARDAAQSQNALDQAAAKLNKALLEMRRVPDANSDILK